MVAEMISEGRIVGDGSWELRILVTELHIERVLRVKSDLHIGGVMLKLVDELGNFCYNIDFLNTIQPVNTEYSLIRFGM